MRHWLKVRVHLGRATKVRQIARYIGLPDPRHAVGLIEEAWAMFMEDSSDGVISGLGRNEAEARAFLAESWDCPHLPAAMESVGWLQITPDGDVVMPGFDRWMTSMDEIEDQREQLREKWREDKRRQRRAAKVKGATPAQAPESPMSTVDSPPTVHGLSSSLLSSSRDTSTEDSQSGVPAAPLGANAEGASSVSLQQPACAPARRHPAPRALPPAAGRSPAPRSIRSDKEQSRSDRSTAAPVARLANPAAWGSPRVPAAWEPLQGLCPRLVASKYLATWSLHSRVACCPEVLYELELFLAKLDDQPPDAYQVGQWVDQVSRLLRAKKRMRVVLGLRAGREREKARNPQFDHFSVDRAVDANEPLTWDPHETEQIEAIRAAVDAIVHAQEAARAS